MRDTHVSADGKREIFGLSKRIREKAWHSTTIDCDDTMVPNISTNDRMSFKNRSFNGFPTSYKIKNVGMTFEDRLRNVLPSDVESVDERLSSSINNSENIVTNQNHPRSYQEHMFMTKQRDLYAMSCRVNYKNNDPRQRRCESAIPPSFKENWNVIENPILNHKEKASTISSSGCKQTKRPSLSQIEAWNQRPRHTAAYETKTATKNNINFQRQHEDKYFSTKSNENRLNDTTNQKRKGSTQSSETEILEFDWSNDTNEGEFSRSGTPILPPLSPVASEDETTPVRMLHDKSVARDEDWHHEMSPTESALDTQDNKQALTRHHRQSILHSTPKQQNDHKQQKQNRRHQKRKKHRRTETAPSNTIVYYDDTDFNKNKNPLQKRSSGFDVYMDQEEIFETASVHSHTNHSVTSSVVRRSTRRHHRNALINADYEKGIRAVNKRFSRLESHVITLAQSVTQLSLDVTNTDATSSVITELQNQLNQVKQAKDGKMVEFHPTKSYQKLTKFFGEEPPVLHFFLRKLGYEKYIPDFDKEDVGIVELPYLDDDKLKSLGIPLGPRVRILEEAKKLTFV